MEKNKDKLTPPEQTQVETSNVGQTPQAPDMPNSKPENMIKSKLPLLVTGILLVIILLIIGFLFSSKEKPIEQKKVVKENVNQLLANSSSVNWSPDKHIVAFITEKAGSQQLWSIESEGSNLKQIKNDEGYFVNNIIWSPDSINFAFKNTQSVMNSSESASLGGAGEGPVFLRVYNTKTGILTTIDSPKLPKEFYTFTDQFTKSAWVGSNNLLIIISGFATTETSGIWNYSLTTKKSKHLFNKSIVIQDHSILLSPDKKYFIFTYYAPDNSSGGSGIINLNSGIIIDLPKFDIRQAAWSPDGKFVAYQNPYSDNNDNGGLWITNLITKESKRLVVVENTNSISRGSISLNDIKWSNDSGNLTFARSVSFVPFGDANTLDLTPIEKNQVNEEGTWSVNIDGSNLTKVSSQPKNTQETIDLTLTPIK